MRSILCRITTLHYRCLVYCEVKHEVPVSARSGSGKGGRNKLAAAAMNCSPPPVNWLGMLAVAGVFCSAAPQHCYRGLCFPKETASTWPSNMPVVLKTLVDSVDLTGPKPAASAFLTLHTQGQSRPDQAFPTRCRSKASMRAAWATRAPPTPINGPLEPASVRQEQQWQA